MSRNFNQNNANKSKFSIESLKNNFWIIGLIIFFIFGIINSTETYSEGERIGYLTKFSKKGRFWKSWEGELNLTQTGMNTSSLFEFSIDNDKESNYLVTMIDSAVNNGWKIKVSYHETYFKNWLQNRGETNYFIKSIEVLDRNGIGSNIHNSNNDKSGGRVVDTIYVVIDKNELKNRK
ncbi:Hypothetical transmembrane protein [Flavobacterium branchiophilum]|uniref:Hypothetical transmembrane protein n=1 Tax=Flavobacterium branchiophilum (strain FL-15) TaxID=1034807 RepID=G2Z0G5_FLABF|nr:hypothetical protein [Flavobacterium branchiophilum]CCB69356.1 Hypothetical transmembrane protein [Flavobacterium branchiophilum FL-15]